MKLKLAKVGIVAGVALVVIIPAFALLRNWTNGSAEGSVHTGTPIAHQESLSQVNAPLQLDTPYFTTKLPGNFVLKRQNALSSDGPILFQLSANTDGKTDEQLGATIGTMPTEGMSGVSDYKLRVTDTATYTPYLPESLPKGAVAFHTISGPAAVTIFWPHGEQYAELSISTDGAASQAKLENTLSKLLAAWAWK